MNERDDCVDEDIPFSWSMALPDDMEPSRYLLHVRSLNGKAVNHMFTVIDPVLPPIH